MKKNKKVILKKSSETCGFCKEACGNNWCPTVDIKTPKNEEGSNEIKCPVVEKVKFEMRNAAPRTIHILEEFEILLDGMSFSGNSSEKDS